jgi:predicted ATPase/DNA-binding SARP family transcriptional activator
MTADLHIQLFGGLEIRIDDAPVTTFISNKAPALLAYLAVTRRPQQRDTLAALFWGEMGDADAKNNLRQTLTSLRKTLDRFLEITRETVALRADASISSDVATFETALRTTRHADEATRPTQLQIAVDTYRGDFLEGILVRDALEFEEWALAQRTRYRELALQAFHQLTECNLIQADYSAAIDAATRQLALDPWREDGYRQLMLALARTGQYVAAMTQYRRCCTVMRETFAADPTDETTALYERIRAAQRGPRHNLPAALTGFVGRTTEIEAIRRRLLMPTCRLLTIVGPGGSGKTRLALETAVTLTPIFLNGVWFVSLAAVTADEPESLAANLATALRIPLTAGNLRRQVIEFLRTREMLLVLDNLEHLLDDIGWFGDLLSAAPDVKILATSRERLNLQAEQVAPLGGLPIPARDDPAPERHAAVELFLRRSRRVQPDFVLTPQTGPAIVQICGLVGGLPLGIELAAAWVSQFACAEIAAAITENLDFLTTTQRDVSPRQRSLRAAFDYSWRLLSTTDQAAFAQLAVFRGSFTRNATAEVAGVRLAALAGLVDKSLVRRNENDRYDLHEVLRQFAQEQLQAMANAAEVRARYIAYYLQLLHTQTPRLKNSEQAAALALIAAEIDNVRSAWTEAAAQCAADALNAAAEGLYHFFMLRSWLVEGLELFRCARQALEAAPPPTNTTRRLALAEMRTREAKFLFSLSRFAEAGDLLRAALRDLDETTAPANVATARHYLGQVYVSTGAYDVAAVELSASLMLRRRLDDRWGQAVTLLEQSALGFYQGDLTGAQAHCLAGLEVAEQVGDPQTIAHLLTALSILSRELGDFQAAQHYAERGLAVYEALDSIYGRIQGLLTLGGLALAQKEYLRSQPAFERALALSRSISLRTGEADSHYRLGQVALAQGDEGRAASHLRQALQLATTMQEVSLIFDALYATVNLLVAHPSPAAVDLMRWLIDRKEIDDQRRSKLTVLFAFSDRNDRTESRMSINEAVGLAIELITPDDTTLDWGTAESQAEGP